MTESFYSDARLAAVYDALNPPGDDTAYYIALAGETPLQILDIGCGTGWLAVELANRGHMVTGADPSDAMLSIARARPGAELVTWLHSPVEKLSVPARYDLVIMTGHAFQTLLEDQAIAKGLASIRSHLVRGGAFAFETRNSDAREWLEWTPEATRETVITHDVGVVETFNDITQVDGPLVTYESHFSFGNGDRLTTRDTVRFMGQDELDRFLRAAGFSDIQWQGDWDGSPVHPENHELIVVAR